MGPVDAAIRASTAALAGALPLNVAGIILLRLIKDVNDVGLDDLTLRAFQDAGFPEIDAYFPSPVQRASQHARRSRVALLYALGLAAVSIALTATGMTAALWHIGHWIAVVLLFCGYSDVSPQIRWRGIAMQEDDGIPFADVHIRHGGVAHADALSKRRRFR